MSLVTPEEVQTQVAVGVDLDTLQTIIDREERWLGRLVGPLVGERVLDYYSPSPVALSRPATSVEVAGVDPANVSLVDGRTVYIANVADPYPISVTWTPDDELEVRQAVIDLCRITLSASPYAAESADTHAYTRGASVASQRESVARRLLFIPRTATVSFAG